MQQKSVGNKAAGVTEGIHVLQWQTGALCEIQFYRRGNKTKKTVEEEMLMCKIMSKDVGAG